MDGIYIDFHTHRIRRTNDQIEEIVSIDPSRPRETQYFTIGHHPWWAEGLLNIEQLDYLKTQYISNPLCLGIGEFGLDNLKGPPLDVQMNIVRQHLALASELSAPVIIHCVRAYHHLFELKKEYPNIQNWVIHGYARHKTLAKDLIDQGFYLSVAPNSHSAITFEETIKYLPIDRMFLETDSHPNIKIEEVYQYVCHSKGLTNKALISQIEENVQNFFSKFKLGSDSSSH